MFARTPRALRAAALILSLAAGASLLSGCSLFGEEENERNNLNRDAANYRERPIDMIYADGWAAIRNGNWALAAAQFNEMERQHPYSPWARRAMLMSAFCSYQANIYDDTIATADQYISLHPGSAEVSYAFYLKAVALYEQIVDVGRDQRTTELALAALEEVERRFPDSKYARDAKLKLDLTKDHLAGKEMEIGRYYLNRGNYLAAINRFRNVVEKYQTTTHVPEALHRIAECYTAVGIDPEAKQTAAVLGYNYPGSEWYIDSYQMLTGETVRDFDGDGKPDREDDGGFFSFRWLNPF